MLVWLARIMRRFAEKVSTIPLQAIDRMLLSLEEASSGDAFGNAASTPQAFEQGIREHPRLARTQ
jgi:hypothetical protein